MNDDDTPRYYCPRCRTEYWEAGDCDWCPVPLLAHVNGSRHAGDEEQVSAH